LFLAASQPTVIKRMILTDIGAFIPKESLARIKSYVGNDPRFVSRAAAFDTCKSMLATFGPHTDEQFELLIRHYIREGKNATTGAEEWRFHYDPSIAVPFKAAADADVPLWAIWDQIKCPVRVLRGSESDVLLASTAAEMKTRGPPTEVVEFAGVGHAPTLIAEDQLRAVIEFAESK
jgi:pimeloyl-ACP methyl ester carboxylesterase